MSWPLRQKFETQDEIIVPKSRVRPLATIIDVCEFAAGHIHSQQSLDPRLWSSALSVAISDQLADHCLNQYFTLNPCTCHRISAWRAIDRFISYIQLPTKSSTLLPRKALAASGQPWRDFSSNNSNKNVLIKLIEKINFWSKECWK